MNVNSLELLHAFICSAPVAWIRSLSFGACFKSVDSFLTHVTFQELLFSPFTMHEILDNSIWNSRHICFDIFYLKNTFSPCRNLWNLVFATFETWIKLESRKLTCTIASIFSENVKTSMHFFEKNRVGALFFQITCMNSRSSLYTTRQFVDCQTTFHRLSGNLFAKRMTLCTSAATCP